jgi:aryl-alcohol dehydrogenase-like predicted oxidoreductase
MMQLPVRSLGRTGIRVRALGLGCATFGQVRPDYTDDDAVAAIRHAVDLGLDFVDTSVGYGESERRVGLALQGGYRERVHLQTKAGTHPERRQDYSAEATRFSVESSLRRLRTDHLDSILIHDPRDIEDPLGAGRMLDELLAMKERGVVRWVGLGVRSHDFLCRAIDSGRIDIVLTHLDYTLLDQTALDRVIPMAQERGVGVILGSILASGRLAGPEPTRDPRAH